MIYNVDRVCFRIAQLVEHSTVNRMVAGSSPAPGAISGCSSVVELLLA